MFKSIGTKFKKIDIGKSAKNIGSALGRGGAAVGKAYLTTSSFAYDVGRFNPYLPLSHTSTHPHVYDQMHLPLVKDLFPLERVGLDPTNITVSIPFEMKGQKIYALK